MDHRSLQSSSAMSFRGTEASSSSFSCLGFPDDSKNTYMELQMKKAHRYVIFKIDEQKKQVLVEKTGHRSDTYDDFTASLPRNECRYAVFDFDFVTHENCQKSKIFFIAWSPSVASIRSKVLYSTSKARFRQQQLHGIHYEIQATDPIEMDIQVLKQRAK